MVTSRVSFAPVFALLAVGAFGVAPPSPRRSFDPAPQAQTTRTTTLDDQTDLAVTVYNSNIALVRDVRRLTIARGTSDLHFMDIAATVNPATVHFRSLSEPSRATIERRTSTSG